MEPSLESWQTWNWRRMSHNITSTQTRSLLGIECPVTDDRALWVHCLDWKLVPSVHLRNTVCYEKRGVYLKARCITSISSLLSFSGDRVSLYSPGWPGPSYVDSWNPAYFCLLSARIKGQCHRAGLVTIFFKPKSPFQGPGVRAQTH